MTEFGVPATAQGLFQQTNVDRQLQSDVLLQPEVYPLGQFSQFVLLRQPELLREIRSGAASVSDLYTEQEEQLDSLLPSDIARVISDPQQTRIALLDTGFAISAITFSGGMPSERLVEFNRQLAEVAGLSEKMTFQKIVTINSSLPYEAMRTFTDGDARNTERDFYYGHALMNAPLEVATLQTQHVQGLLRNGDIDEADRVLQEIDLRMQEFATAMSSYNRHMDPAHFAIFREYINQYPDGTRNASGAFIGMPRLQLRLTGTSASYDTFLAESMRYFSPDDQADIALAQAEIEQGSLVDLCEQLPTNHRGIVAKRLYEILRQLDLFRRRHYVAVMRFVPEAIGTEQTRLHEQLQQPDEPILGEGVVGTGGFLPGPLMRNIMRLNLREMNRLERMIQGSERRGI